MSFFSLFSFSLHRMETTRSEDKSINDMTAPELQDLINANSTPGMRINGDIYERIIYPAQQRLKELGASTQTAVRAVFVD